MKDLSKDSIQIGIVGAGVMGRSIAQVFAVSGINVTIMDLEPGVCEKAKDFVVKTLRRAVEKTRLVKKILQMQVYVYPLHLN